MRDTDERGTSVSSLKRPGFFDAPQLDENPTATVHFHVPTSDGGDGGADVVRCR